MKNLIFSITCLTLVSLSLTGTVTAEIKSGIVPVKSDAAEIEIEEGQVAHILYLKQQYGTEKIGMVHYEKNGIRTPVITSGISAVLSGQGGRKFAGPGKLIFQNIARAESTIYALVYSIEVLPNKLFAESSGRNNITVIPDTAEDSTLVLEGSDDMVNWTTETLGDKPKANRKKFYRLRAKKK